MALYGPNDSLITQVATNKKFSVAYAYIKKLLDPKSAEHKSILQLKKGENRRVELTEGVFSSEQAYMTKPDSDCRWESHEKYIDWQVMIVGEEIMEVINVKELSVAIDERPKNDLIFYGPHAGATPLRTSPGIGAIFFPVDAHRPCLQTKGKAAPAVKAVLKIPLA